eukprot:9473163-Pyramimonas_sp.AAC.2
MAPRGAHDGHKRAHEGPNKTPRGGGRAAYQIFFGGLTRGPLGAASGPSWSHAGLHSVPLSGLLGPS